MAVINGIEEKVSEVTVLEYLNSVGINAQRVVVEINFEIVPRDQYDKVTIRDTDSVEILNFVGGG